jgi:hypothetical protein
MKVAQYPPRRTRFAFLEGLPSRPVRHSQDDKGGTGRSMVAYAREAAYERPGTEGLC